MKTKKQTEKQELKYAPGDKVVYHCAEWTEKDLSHTLTIQTM